MRKSEGNGPFSSCKTYIRKLLQTLQGIFDVPNDLKCLKLRTDNQGRVVGWEIEETKFIFKGKNDYVKIIERAENHNITDCFYLDSFSYHFEPSDINDLMRFRVDLDNISLHGNPDERFSDKAHLCQPIDIGLQLDQYNALAAIYVAHRYMNSGDYPFDNQYADTYNKIICSVLGGQKVG